MLHKFFGRKFTSVRARGLTERAQLTSCKIFFFSPVCRPTGETCSWLSGKDSWETLRRCLVSRPDYVSRESNRSNFIKSAYRLQTAAFHTVHTHAHVYFVRCRRDLETDLIVRYVEISSPPDTCQIAACETIDCANSLSKFSGYTVS